MKITFVHGDDWEGAYIDGKLVCQSHSVSAWDILRALGMDYESVEADEEWLNEHGRLPEELTSVKRSEDTND